MKKAALLFGDIAVAATQAQRIQKAYEAAGFNFVYVKKTGIILESYTSQVEEMKSKPASNGSPWCRHCRRFMKLLRDMDTQDFKPQVIDLGQQYYDPASPTSQGAEGAFVQVNTAPFEEVARNPALQVYDGVQEGRHQHRAHDARGAGVLRRAALRPGGEGGR